MSKKIKAYAYIRYSTSSQSSGDSERRQLEAAEKYAKKRNLDLDASGAYRDLAVSAFLGANSTTGELGRFLTNLENGQIPKGSYLLVENFDRLSRQGAVPAISLFFKILTGGVNVVTLSDEKEYAAGLVGFEELMQSLRAMSNAHEESAKKSHRLTAAWQQKKIDAKDGKVITRVAPKWLAVGINENGKRQFTVTRKHAAIVNRIFDLAWSGRGQATIARTLTKEGTPRFDGKRLWHGSSVAKILSNRAVLGEYAPHKRVNRTKRVSDGDPIKNYYPSIVQEDKFNAVNAVRKNRWRKGGRHTDEIRNLLPI